MHELIRQMIPEENINARVCELAEQISRDLNGEPLKLICILKGSAFFACELAKRLTVPVLLDFMSVSSYGDETVSSGKIKIKKDLDDPIEGQNVLVVEDIIDSGRTLSALVPLLKSRGPKRVLLVTLLDKPERREMDVHVDYVGFQIPDRFVVGFGLDYAQKYRSLPFVGELEFVGDEEGEAAAADPAVMLF